MTAQWLNPTPYAKACGVVFVRLLLFGKSWYNKRMKVENTFPPNYHLIITAIPAAVSDNTAIFAYGDTIYNPHNCEITPDREVHEQVHQKQQGNYIDEWYLKYLSNSEFRLSQEIEAYGEQYKWICDNIDAHVAKGSKLPSARLKRHALDSLSFSLSSASYGQIIGFGEAKSKIKNYSS